MDSSADLSTWRKLLTKLGQPDREKKYQALTELSYLFEHVTPRVAVRQQKDYESNLKMSEQLLDNLFDELDLADRPLFCAFLQTLRSYGYLRIAQISCHIDVPCNTFEPDHVFSPEIEKHKWYDLCPLLPKAGSIGWKYILNHGLDKTEKPLIYQCLWLLNQKLHFYCILLNLPRYRDFSPIIRRNGEKTAAKLFELIRDIALDDESLVGLDVAQYELLNLFIDSEQKDAIIDATLQDTFKPYLVQIPANPHVTMKLHNLISKCFMNSSDLQGPTVSKLVAHLRYNLIRRKRRLSVETAMEGNPASIEKVIDMVNDGENLDKLLEMVVDVDITAKSFQTNYLSYWLNTVDKVIPRETLTSSSSLKLLLTCLMVLIPSTEIISIDLVKDISIFMSKIIADTMPNKVDKLLCSIDPIFIMKLTKIMSEKTHLLASFDSPVQSFYKEYLRRYLRCCSMKHTKTNPEKLGAFVEFVCDKSLDKSTQHLLQYLCIREMSWSLLAMKSRLSSKSVEFIMGWFRACSGRLYKFIKRNTTIKPSFRDEGDDTDTSNILNDTITLDAKKTVAIDALICIIRVAIDRNDRDLLDSYSDLVLKLFQVMKLRVEKIVETMREGGYAQSSPLDSQIPNLINLFVERRQTIQAYIDYDPLETLPEVLLPGRLQTHHMHDTRNGLKECDNKKSLYKNLKSRLGDLEKKAGKSDNVYSTIINKQYTSVVNPVLGSSGLETEAMCSNENQRLTTVVKGFAPLLFAHCNQKTYKRVLNEAISSLEQCDPLDHPGLLYNYALIESLIPKQSAKNAQENLNNFIEVIPRISCSLIKITKYVELGPSIHAFTKTGTHKSNLSIQCCTYANSIRVFTSVFAKCPAKSTNSSFADAMQLCIGSNLIQYAKRSDRLHNLFIQLAMSIVNLLKSMCIGRKEEELLKSSVPVFTSVFSHLIRCIIIASDRKKLDKISQSQNCNGSTKNPFVDRQKTFEKNLQLLALDVGRTFNNMSSLRVKFIDYAPHMISAYIKDIQEATCPNSVQLYLNEGIFRIFNLIDAHQRERQDSVIDAGVQRKTTAARASGSLFEMIHSRLDQASREIFRDLHDNYNRFHRYIGRC